MIGAASSGAMMSVDTVEDVKRACLLAGEGVGAEAVEHGKMLAVALRQRGGRRVPSPEGSVSLSQRRPKASGWDVHAPGYE